MSLSDEEIREIRERVERRLAIEQEARRSRMPRWDPADSPWRSLNDTVVASLKACKELSLDDLEAIFNRGRERFSGTRSDRPFGPPDRIEEPLAKAERRRFCFWDNSIYATYDTAGRGPRTWGPGSDREISGSITFRDVRVHWLKHVELLQEAGFQLGSQRPIRESKAARERQTRGRDTSEPDAATPTEPRKATEPDIDLAIRAVYDQAERDGEKPPNIKELIKPVQAKLAATGLKASGLMIMRVGNEPQHKKRRWEQGRTKKKKSRDFQK